MIIIIITNILIIIKIKLILAQRAVTSSASLTKMIIIAPMSSATALVLVEMAVEDTMEKEPMRTKKNWRKTILEPDDESGVKQMLL